ncbi:MAG TPA: methyl-accepting chemotaxis protein [Xanthobacteraceae bacterium]|nr:methyl-accepting chemotaxis protein [Xanthobacteraceae bacterium]
MSKLLSMHIGGRLIAGFGALCAVLATAVIYTIYVVGGVTPTVDRMVTLRVPVALQSTELVGNLYSTLATLRGYLLTGNPQGKADRAAMWKELDATAAEFDRKVERFTDPENKRKWTEARALLAEFRAAQEKAEALAFTPDAFPATKFLVNEAAPRATLIFSEISKMLDEEERLEATAERKRLLKAMADVRGNLAAATAQLRMFLLSGDKANKDEFARLWASFERAYATLETQQAMFTPTQKVAFETIAKTRAEFASMPEKMFAIRESAQWNEPVHILVSEAAPRALKILDLVDGPKQTDGTRSGGIKSSQKKMLTQEADEVQDGMSFLSRMQWILLACGTTLAAAIGFFTVRSIVPPLRRMTGMMGKLAAGDTSVEVPGTGRHDEIGAMAGAVQVFKDSMIEAERLRAEQAEAERRMAAQRKADMHRLADEFQAAVGNIVETVSSASTELEAAAGTLSKTAEVTQGLSGTVAAASEQASANVQSVASATEEMTSSVNEISRQVQESAKIAGDAVKQAQQTDGRINQLSQAAGRIGDVVKLITAIAEQTNLLALNATIEAARAGEAGRGFAVVASEVKALAAQTGKATEEIGTQIAGMQAATQESVTAIKEIGGTIGRISQIASTIAAAVEEQGAATQEIARNVGEAAKGTAQVASNITDVNRGAGETGAASAQVLASAQSLSSESNHLKVEVDRFLATVRAA